MNKSDSERLKLVLEGIDMSETDQPERADIIILNTCSVRQNAEDRVYGLMHNYGKLKEARPHLILGVTGCMVGHDTKKKLWKRMPMVDLYFPISEIENLPKKITELRYEQVTDDLTSDSPVAYLKLGSKYASSFEAFVPIMSGCNKFCTFCIVPYSRGREKSRTGVEVLQEIRALKERDYQLVTLLGQNVNSYHPEDNDWKSSQNPYRDDFAALLWEINQIGIPWVHFTAPHPRDMSDEVIDALTLPCMVNYLHLPVQAGDDTVLKRMNRGYTRQNFLDLVGKIKAKKPAMALGTDIIVGFPGETDEQFQHTVELYGHADFDISYTAIYSPRSHTPAARMPGQVSLKTKKERWNTLQILMESIVERKNQTYQNQLVEVLIREHTEHGYVGDTFEMKRLTVEHAPHLIIGKRYTVRVHKTSTWMLYGTLENEQSRVESLSVTAPRKNRLAVVSNRTKSA